MGSLSSNPGRDWDSYIDDCERAHSARLAEGLIPCDGECGEYFPEDELKESDGDYYCLARCWAHERRRLAKSRLVRMRAKRVDRIVAAEPHVAAALRAFREMETALAGLEAGRAA